MAKKKILIIDNGPFVMKNGQFYSMQSTGSLVEDLASQGFSVELLQFYQKAKSDEVINGFNISDLGIKIHAFKYYTSWIKYLVYIWVYFKTIFLCMKLDFIYLFFPNSFRFISFILSFFNKSFGLNIRGEKHLTDKSSIWIFKHAKLIFTVSPHFSEFVSSYNTNVFDKRPTILFSEMDSVSRNYSKKDNFKLMYLGRLDIDKGILDLVNAISLLNSKSSISFELNIVGNGDAILQVQSLINKLRISNIHLCGGVFEKEELKRCYLTSDLYVLPTYHEGFPRTLYECMVFGTPILTTFVGGIPYLMSDGFNCFEIISHSPSNIAERIEYVLKHYSDMCRICQNAKETFINKMQSLPNTHGKQLGIELKKIL